jgi:hypothetical protein
MSRRLRDLLADDAPPVLPGGYWRNRPVSERVQLFRRLRERVPDLEVGDEYRVAGRVRLAPGRTLAAGETLKARLHSVFTDTAQPYCVFIETRAEIEYYFRVSLQDLVEELVRVER